MLFYGNSIEKLTVNDYRFYILYLIIRILCDIICSQVSPIETSVSERWWTVSPPDISAFTEKQKRGDADADDRRSYSSSQPLCGLL